MDKSKLNSFNRKLLAKRTNKSLEDLTLAEAVFLVSDNSPQAIVDQKMHSFQLQAYRLAKRFQQHGFFRHFIQYADSSGYRRWRINPDLDEETQKEVAEKFRRRLFREQFRVKKRKTKNAKSTLSRYYVKAFKDKNESLESVIESHLRYHKGKGDCASLTTYFTAMCEWFGVENRILNIPGHCCPANMDYVPFEMGVWDGIGYERQNSKFSCYYGFKPDKVDKHDNEFDFLIAVALNHRGTVLNNQRKTKKASKYYRMSAKASNLSIESVLNLAENLARDKKFKAADWLMGRLLLKWPHYSGYIFRMSARIQNMQGNKEEALRCLIKSSKEFRDKEDDVMLELAEQYESMEKYEKAIYWYKRAIARKKFLEEYETFYPLYSISHCLNELGDFENARKTINMAIKKARTWDDRQRAFYMKALYYYSDDNYNHKKYHLAAIWFKKSIREEVLGGSNVSKRSLQYLWKCAQRISDKPKRKQFKNYVRRYATPEQLESLEQLSEAA
ncbi:hypothetical protein KY325_04690 [Candidatus Woesearchaeota archaeon]|nr:hypothetical protein [Candidatus Woesearchaeota archaeon]